MENKVNDLGQAVNVLVQVAQLAQSKGVLTLAEAVIVKNAIDFITELQKSQEKATPQIETDGPTPIS